MMEINTYEIYLRKVCVLLSLYSSNFRDDYTCFNCDRFFKVSKEKKTNKRKKRKKSQSKDETDVSSLG